MKQSAIVRIIVWSLVAALLTGAMVVGIVFSGLQSGRWTFGFSGNTYRNAADYSIGGASLTDQIDRLSVHWICGSVTVEAYDGDTVEIKETAVADSDDELRYLVQNGRLTIQFRKSGFFFGLLVHTPEKNLTVLLPQEMADAMQSVDIDTVSADISVSNLTVTGTLQTDGVSGRVQIQNTSAKKLNCDTVSGSTTAENVTLDALSFDGVSADCNISGTVDEVDFDSTSGSLKLESSATPQEIDTDTVSGDIRLTLPENSSFTAEFDSVSGDFNCDTPLQKHGDRHICGDGSADFSFESVSGDVTIYTK